MASPPVESIPLATQSGDATASTPDLIASTALDHYFKVLPSNKGKPQPGQWTVYAAIVATRKSTSSEEVEDAWVVSCATGSKCTTMQPALSHFGQHVPKCEREDIGKSMCGCKKKCCDKQIKGFVLHDSHAEVLARRGLVRVLWEEIIFHMKQQQDTEEQETSPSRGPGTLLLQTIKKRDVSMIGHSDDKNSSSKKKEASCKADSFDLSFELKDTIQIHLYISDSPCGDGSIYDIAPKYVSNANCKNHTGLNFTGAKIIVPQDDKSKSKSEADNFFLCSSSISKPQTGLSSMNPESNIKIAREKIQIKSALRLKSGRSNIPDHLRSSSMSCSDKICKWTVVGLQGCGILARFLPNCIRLSSVVVSRDPRLAKLEDGLDTQLDALERAIILRAKGVVDALKSSIIDDDCYRDYIDFTFPSVHITDHLFPLGKAAIEKQRIDDSVATRALTHEHTPVAKEPSCTKDKLHQDITSETTTQPEGKKRSIECQQNDRTPKRQKLKKISPCGISLNWQQQPFQDYKNSRGDSIEQTVGAKGIIQRKKPKLSGDIIKCASRLSRYSLWNQALQALTLSRISLSKDEVVSYQQTKELHAPSKMRKMMHLVISDIKNPLQGWVQSSSESDFYPHSNI